jgi:hypothetical protein
VSDTVKDGLGVYDTLIVMDGVEQYDVLCDADPVDEALPHVVGEIHAVKDGLVETDRLRVSDTVKDRLGVYDTLVEKDGVTHEDALSVGDVLGETLPHTVGDGDDEVESDTVAQDVDEIDVVTDGLVEPDGLRVKDDVTDTLALGAGLVVMDSDVHAVADVVCDNEGDNVAVEHGVAEREKDGLADWLGERDSDDVAHIVELCDGDRV